MKISKSLTRSPAAASMPQRGRPRKFDRAKAVHTAMEVFWKNGYMQTTMNDLCKAIGITAPSFYCAFISREDLFIEIIGQYMRLYWNDAIDRLMAEKDIHAAIRNFFADAVKVFVRPSQPRGCFLDISLTGLPQKEARIKSALGEAEKKWKDLFSKRCRLAIAAGQLDEDSDISAIAGALFAFLKGLAGLAREDMAEDELLRIASHATCLLPARREQVGK